MHWPYSLISSQDKDLSYYSKKGNFLWCQLEFMSLSAASWDALYLAKWPSPLRSTFLLIDVPETVFVISCRTNKFHSLGKIGGWLLIPGWLQEHECALANCLRTWSLTGIVKSWEMGGNWCSQGLHLRDGPWRIGKIYIGRCRNDNLFQVKRILSFHSIA